MEFGTIEREIHVEASPEIVFEVITSPEHIREWWNGAQTTISPTPGPAEIVWNPGTADQHGGPLTVIEAEPPRLFSFRWTYEDEQNLAGSSLLVTFELVPSDSGTLIKLTETGFREKGWEAAVLEAAYADHVRGWDTFVASLAEYADKVAESR